MASLAIESGASADSSSESLPLQVAVSRPGEPGIGLVNQRGGAQHGRRARIRNKGVSAREPDRKPGAPVRKARPGLH